jgi:hypothetical protein
VLLIHYKLQTNYKYTVEAVLASTNCILIFDDNPTIFVISGNGTKDSDPPLFN